MFSLPAAVPRSLDLSSLCDSPIQAQGASRIDGCSLIVTRFRFPFVAACAFTVIGGAGFALAPGEPPGAPDRFTVWNPRGNRGRNSYQINIYEQMFHPFDLPSFSAAGQVKLDGNKQHHSRHNRRYCASLPHPCDLLSPRR